MAKLMEKVNIHSKIAMSKELGLPMSSKDKPSMSMAQRLTRDHGLTVCSMELASMSIQMVAFTKENGKRDYNTAWAKRYTMTDPFMKGNSRRE